MNTINRLIFLLMVGSMILLGCGDKEPNQGPIVLEVGNQKVDMAEYENFYAKNAGGWDAAKQSSQEDRERFLDLLAEYKLKLQDAYSRGYEKDTEIQMELREYRSSLAASFLIDKEITEPGVRVLYDRRAEELRTQNIVLTVKPGAPPEDTLAIYNKALDIIKQANAGVPFDSLVVQYSEEPNAKITHGDVYYFTSGQLASIYESAAYGMKKGEIAQKPLRTPAGYYILKVVDRKPSQYMVKVRHIMMRFSVSATDSADTTNALLRIKGVQDSLKKGMKFADLAVKLSEDGGSASEGGDLGWFERRRWVQPFDEAAFNLTAGQTSGIVKTPFGFHLLYCDSVKNIPPFSDLKDELKKRYQQLRFNEEYEAYLEQLKKEYRYKLNDDIFQAMLAGLDSTASVDDSAWSANIPPDVLKKTLFSVDGNSTIVDTVVALLNRKMEYRGTTLRESDLRSKIERMAESAVIDVKSVGLETKYPQFASLMQEYKDGIILFKAEQQEVWNKVTVTDSALKAYYTKNKERFKYPNRVAYSAIEVDADTLALLIYDSLMHGGDFSEFAERYNTDPDMKAKKGAYDLAPVSQDDFTMLADSMEIGQLSEPRELTTGGYIIMKITKKESERIKTYEEAGAELSNAFQEAESKRLEKLWVDRIRETHPVLTHKELLKDAFVTQPNP